jgi:hypothetical protein
MISISLSPSRAVLHPDYCERYLSPNSDVAMRRQPGP